MTLKQLLRLLQCLLGWHEFTWKFNRGDVLNLHAPPPDHATCRHCRIRYKKETTTAKP